MIRAPAVAGSFYPERKEDLLSVLNTLFLHVRKRYDWDKKCPKIIISPHAGIYFSGLVAAYGYKNLENCDISTVFLLGVSHNFFFREAVVDSSEFWVTPLGKVKVDEATILEISKVKGVEINTNPHFPEHTLEMQLIFLQKVLKSKFKIVPILLSQPTTIVKKSLVNYLSGRLKNKGTVMIVSTDLSHYPAYDVANRLDSFTVEKVLQLSSDFSEWIDNFEIVGKNKVDTLMCGKEAVKICIEIAKKMNLEDVRYYKYLNSGDVSGEMGKVVGYMSVGFYLGKQNYRVEALQIARRKIEFYLRTGKKLKVDCKNKELKKRGGVFVTLEENKQLRGCIGDIVSNNSYCVSLQENALNAAINDPRFYPVNLAKIHNLDIEVSLLSPLKRVENWRKVKLGKDGVVIKRGINSGVFLPQVAEKIPNLEEFLSLLCEEKAGLEPDCYKNPSTEIYTFTADVFKE